MTTYNLADLPVAFSFYVAGLFILERLCALSLCVQVS